MTAATAEQFPPDPAAVARARMFLRAALGELGPEVSERDLADTLVLAANELVTNAVMHARTGFTVRVMLEPGAVRVEVSDENSQLPQPRVAPPDATSGRGLLVVAGSGLQWGVDGRDDGKTVWLQAPRWPLTASPCAGTRCRESARCPR